ncbi:MAG: hypothetical protein U5N53_17725 [Mycobacterium sp.]|nr:hypothetical protein [Mycobacterium sp.]
MLDDFCGSGTHLSSVVLEVVEALSNVDDEWFEDIHIVVGAAVVSDLERLPKSPTKEITVEPVAGQLLGQRYRPLSADSGVFDSDREREDASEMLAIIGRALLPSNPLGFGGESLLALLEFNCPNNASPAFWKKGTYAGTPCTRYSAHGERSPPSHFCSCLDSFVLRKRAHLCLVAWSTFAHFM